MVNKTIAQCFTCAVRILNASQPIEPIAYTRRECKQNISLVIGPFSCFKLQHRSFNCLPIGFGSYSRDNALFIVWLLRSNWRKTPISGEGGVLCGLNILFLNPNILLKRAREPHSLTVACNVAARARKRETSSFVVALRAFDVENMLAKNYAYVDNKWYNKFIHLYQNKLTSKFGSSLKFIVGTVDLIKEVETLSFCRKSEQFVRHFHEDKDDSYLKLYGKQHVLCYLWVMCQLFVRWARARSSSPWPTRAKYMKPRPSTDCNFT